MTNIFGTGRKKKTNNPPQTHSWVMDEEYKAGVLERANHTLRSNNDRKEAVTKGWSLMLNPRGQGFKWQMLKEDKNYNDHPIEVPFILTESEHMAARTYKSKLRRRLYATKSTFQYVGFLAAIKRFFTYRPIKAQLRQSIGQYYRSHAFDPTISEAFDAGFYTCYKMLEAGWITIEEKTDD